jgi:hypothetical protein
MINDKHNYPPLTISAFYPTKNRDGQFVPGVYAKDADLYQELFKIKNGVYSYIIEETRNIHNKDDRNKYKAQNLPGFTFSCKFKNGDYRKQENILSQTNILCVDVDFAGAAEYIGRQKDADEYYSIEDLRDELAATVPCLFAGVSCGGNGVFLLIRYEENQHLDCFLDIEDLLKAKFGIAIDASCKDYARLRFASYDVTCQITPWPLSKIYTLRADFLEKRKKIEELKRQEYQQIVVAHKTDVSGKILERALSMIYTAKEGERHNKIRAASRLLGGYIATNLLDEAYVKESLYNAVVDIKYDDLSDAQKAIEFGVSSGKGNPIEVSIITPDDPQFAFFTEQTEFRQREIKALYTELRNKIQEGVAYTSLDFVELGARFLLDTDRIQKIAHRLYEKHANEYNINNKPFIFRVETFLSGKYEFRRDVITDIIEARQLGESKYKTIRIENIYRDMQQHGLKYKFDDLSRLLRSDFVPEINIWEEHFKSLKVPSKTFDYIGALSSYIRCVDDAEQPYFAEMFKKMLVRTIKCSLDEHYANRTVFVLASHLQSNGKSSFIRWLSPFGPHQYYAENPIEDNKDARIRMSETFIYNLEELSTSTKTEINRMKAIISQIGTRDRKPYGRQAENIVRRCSFFGSTNNINFLTDDTNTRWLCFEIRKIDWRYQDEIDINHVWAQAYHLYTTGYLCELTPDEAARRDIKNDSFSVTTIEQDLVRRYFEPAIPKDPGSVFLTSTSIHEHLLLCTKESRLNINNVWLGRALNKLGYTKARHKNVSGYWVKEINRSSWDNYRNDGHYTDTE